MLEKIKSYLRYNHNDLWIILLNLNKKDFRNLL